MKNSEMKEIQDRIELANKTIDLAKIKKDIDEGLNLLTLKNEELKKEYLYRINNEYLEYVIAMQMGFLLRRSLLGNSTTRNLLNYDEQITQYVRMLKLVYHKKLYDEIQKVVCGEKNVFEGGILDEKEL